MNSEGSIELDILEKQINKIDGSIPVRSSRRFVAAIIITVLFMLSGIGYYFFADRRKVTADGVAAVKQKSEELTITDESGTLSVGENVSIPENFPKNLPFYPNGNISLISFKDEEGGYLETTSDGVLVIMAWYQRELKKLGWEIELERSNSLKFWSESLTGTISVYPSNEGYSISTSLMEKSNSPESQEDAGSAE